MATANMTTCLHIGQIPVIPREVELIPVAELQITNIDLGNQIEMGHISVPTPDGDHIWIHPPSLCIRLIRKPILQAGEQRQRQDQGQSLG